MRDVCRREYHFDVTARPVGKTLYISCAPQHLVGADLGLQKETIERLYDALLTATRVALSTDAKIDFLVVKAKDSNTGVTVTLVRYVPDIKWYFYMRISRADFEDRGILEIENADAAQDPANWKDITLHEFMARLAASRLQQKITYNPLVSVFVRVHRVEGIFKDGVLTLRLDKFERLGSDVRSKNGHDAMDDILRQTVVSRVADAVEKYDDPRAVDRIRVVEGEDAGPKGSADVSDGRVMFDFSREELLAEKKKLPKTKEED